MPEVLGRHICSNSCRGSKIAKGAQNSMSSFCCFENSLNLSNMPIAREIVKMHWSMDNLSIRSWILQWGHSSSLHVELSSMHPRLVDGIPDAPWKVQCSSKLFFILNLHTSTQIPRQQVDGQSRWQQAPWLAVSSWSARINPLWPQLQMPE